MEDGKKLNEMTIDELVAAILEDPDRMDEIFRSTDDLDALYNALESELLPDGIIFDDAEMYHNSVISEALERLSRDYLYEEPPYEDIELEEITFEDLLEAEEALDDFYKENPELDDRPDSTIPEWMTPEEFGEAMSVDPYINEYGEIIRPAGKSDISPELLDWLNRTPTELKPVTPKLTEEEWNKLNSLKAKSFSAFLAEMSKLPQDKFVEVYRTLTDHEVIEYETWRELSEESKSNYRSSQEILQEFLTDVEKLKQKDKELTALEKEAKTIAEAEALIDKQNAKEGQSIGE